MHELWITRANHLVDPTLSVWAWQIPVYLFLGGWVAGMMVLAGYFILRGRDVEHDCACRFTPWIGLVLLSLGMFALFLDLEHKPYVWRLYTTFEVGSPMSWGAWILLLVYPALLATVLVRPPEWLSGIVPAVRDASRWIGARPSRLRLVAVANIVLGVALGIYTGVLLSALGARPLWNSALLGPLFLLSGLSSAAAFVHMVARNTEEREGLARADNLFLTLELATILLFLVGLLSSTAVHKAAAGLLLGGPFTSVFWVIVVGFGILLPLAIQALAVSHRIQHTALAPLLVLAGGLALRFVIVYAGQASRWAASAADLISHIG